MSNFNVYFCVFIVHYVAVKVWRHFFTCNFLGLLHIQKKTNDIFRILMKFWARNMCFLNENSDLKIWSCSTRPWPDSCQKSSLMVSWGQMTINIDIQVQNDPENTCCTACLWLLFSVTFCDLTLTFLVWSLCSCSTFPGYIKTFRESLSSLRPVLPTLGPNRENSTHFYVWPDLDLIRDTQLTMLSID